MNENNLTETKQQRPVVPIFFAVDDCYAPYLAVAIRSLIDNASPDFDYHIHILIDQLSERHRANLTAMANDHVSVNFVNVREKLDALGNILHLRDYYTKATYYRFFIPDLFPEYSRGIYLDCDIVVKGDISELYTMDTGNALVAAALEEVMLRYPCFGEYVEVVLNVPVNEYFSAGVLVLNLDALREMHIEQAFVELLSRRKFRVTQDQDYLNVLCHGKVAYLSSAWNKTAFPDAVDDSPSIIHYKINWKPWHYKNTAFEEYFWKYAAMTPYYDEMMAMRDNYSASEIERDTKQYESLVELALHDTREYKYGPTFEKDGVTLEQAQDRLEVLDRIREYEKQGYFDRDVEIDPPTRPLEPGEVDYLGEKWTSRLATKIANRAARNYFEGCIKRGELVIKEIKGIENYVAVKDQGALITANHFNAFDNYAVYKAIEPYLGKGKYLYKIIREGNYTSYKGLYGYFFRHCNTLPLSSKMSTLRELIDSVQILLERGEKILIYPEQGMWWNYRKPRPLKLGAFRFAAKAMVPVVPMFITTEDTDTVGADGFAIKAYTVHVLPAIFPDPNKNVRENTKAMCLENYRLWKETYEAVYGEPLSYSTLTEVEPCSI